PEGMVGARRGRPGRGPRPPHRPPRLVRGVEICGDLESLQRLENQPERREHEQRPPAETKVTPRIVDSHRSRASVSHNSRDVGQPQSPFRTQNPEPEPQNQNRRTRTAEPQNANPERRTPEPEPRTQNQNSEP